MNKKNKFLKIFVLSVSGVLCVLFVCGVVLTIIFGSSGIASIKVILEAASAKSPSIRTVNKKPDAPGKFFNSLHEGIWDLDMSKISDNATLGIRPNIYTIPTWGLKEYLNVYMLASEICARPEINRDLTQPQITPEDLMAIWFTQTTMNKGASIYGDEPWSYNRFIDTVTEDGKYAGPYLQSVEPMSLNDSTLDEDNKIMGMYISWRENMDLPEDKRAFIGTADLLNSNKGLVMTGETYDKVKTQGFNQTTQESVASTLFIQDNIKFGSLNSGDIRSTRPNVKYLPDAMYTEALRLRMALDGLDMTGEVNVSNLVYDTQMFEKLNLSLSADHKLKIKKALIHDTLTDVTNSISVDNNSWDTLDTSLKVYVNAVASKDIDWFITDKISHDKLKGYMKDYNSIYRIIFGEDFKAEDKVIEDKINSSELNLINSITSLPQFPLTQQQVIEYKENQKSSLAKSQTYFGYVAVNAGRVVNRTFEDIIRYAVSNESWRYDKEVPEDDNTTEQGQDGNIIAGSCDGDWDTKNPAGGCTNVNCAHTIMNNVEGGSVIRSRLYNPTIQEIKGTLTPGAVIYPFNPNVIRPNAYTTYRGHGFSMDFTRNFLGGERNRDILAIADGIVTYIHRNPNTRGTSPRGTWVEVAHNWNGQIVYSTYLHLDKLYHIWPGMCVKQGTPLGTMGNTGDSTAEHLHLEVTKVSVTGNRLSVYRSVKNSFAPNILYPAITAHEPSGYRRIGIGFM